MLHTSRTMNHITFLPLIIEHSMSLKSKKNCEWHHKRRGRERETNDNGSEVQWTPTFPQRWKKDSIQISARVSVGLSRTPHSHPSLMVIHASFEGGLKNLGMHGSSIRFGLMGKNVINESILSQITLTASSKHKFYDVCVSVGMWLLGCVNSPRFSLNLAPLHAKNSSPTTILLFALELLIVRLHWGTS